MKEDINYILNYINIKYVIRTIDSFGECTWFNANTDEQIVIFNSQPLLYNLNFIIPEFHLICSYQRYVQQKGFKIY